MVAKIEMRLVKSENADLLEIVTQRLLKGRHPCAKPVLSASERAKLAGRGKRHLGEVDKEVLDSEEFIATCAEVMKKIKRTSIPAHVPEDRRTGECCRAAVRISVNEWKRAPSPAREESPSSPFRR